MRVILKWLIFLLLIVSDFTCDAQNGDTTGSGDTTVYKSTLDSLQTTKVKAKKVQLKKDPLDCHICVSDKGVKIKFSGKTYKNITATTLDTFIRDNKIAEVSPMVYLQTGKGTSQEKIKDVIDVLQLNKITRFRLVVK